MSSLPASGNLFIPGVMEMVAVHSNKCTHDLRKKNNIIGFKRTKHGNTSGKIRKGCAKKGPYGCAF